MHLKRDKNREQVLSNVKNLVIQVTQHYPVSIYLFGSWARNEEKRSSDIDLAIDSEREVPPLLLIKLRETLEESLIPYRVDVVDLSKADSVIRHKVEKEGILWKDYKSV